jgi:hypothetical protein
MGMPLSAGWELDRQNALLNQDIFYPKRLISRAKMNPMLDNIALDIQGEGTAARSHVWIGEVNKIVALFDNHLYRVMRIPLMNAINRLLKLRAYGTVFKGTFISALSHCFS